MRWKRSDKSDGPGRLTPEELVAMRSAITNVESLSLPCEQAAHEDCQRTKIVLKVAYRCNCKCHSIANGS